jgi:hypothetical protein
MASDEIAYCQTHDVPLEHCAAASGRRPRASLALPCKPHFLPATGMSIPRQFMRRGVGEGIRASGIACEEIFVTTKLWNEAQSWSRAVAEATLDAAIHDGVIALNAERNSDPLGNRRIV